jgi:hypothetical protein
MLRAHVPYGCANAVWGQDAQEQLLGMEPECCARMEAQEQPPSQRPLPGESQAAMSLRSPCSHLPPALIVCNSENSRLL